MKKNFLIFLLPLCLVACSKSESKPDMNETVKEIWRTLNGSYLGTYYVMDTENVWYTERISFSPYSEPKEIVSLFGSFTAYGSAEIVDTRFESISGTSVCYYSIHEAYSGAIPYISFYECDNDGDVVNKADKRNIRIIGPSSFKLWGYGLTEAENAVLYSK